MSNKRDVIKDKIIFLDFDGVMVTANQTGKDCFGPLFDLDCIKSLKEIISNTEAGLHQVFLGKLFAGYNTEAYVAREKASGTYIWSDTE